MPHIRGIERATQLCSMSVKMSEYNANEMGVINIINNLITLGVLDYDDIFDDELLEIIIDDTMLLNNIDNLFDLGLYLDRQVFEKIHGEMENDRKLQIVIELLKENRYIINDEYDEKDIHDEVLENYGTLENAIKELGGQQ